MKIIRITEASEMSEVAAYLRELITHKETSGAVVVALQGDLGAGKTTLTQTLAKSLGVTGSVTSPTYVVMKSYELPEEKSRFHTLWHIDAYRIEDVDEMRVLRFAELLAEKGTIICIEWPERIASLVPADAITVSIQLEGVGRVITIS